LLEHVTIVAARTYAMSPWTELLRRPDDFADGPAADAWFARIAGRLLNGCRLLAGGRAHRLVEVECYYHGDGHEDPFAHRDPLQRECGRWYFHRSGTSYRGGSFKGLDLAFGDGRAFGGFLIRSLEAPGGELVVGPSLCVDHLLAAAGRASVAALAGAVAGKVTWEPGGVLELQAFEPPEGRPVVRSARVGLTLKKAGQAAGPPRFVLRPYRFLTEPRRVGKGKLHVVLALHAQGMDPDRISALTGCPRASVRRHVELYEVGNREGDFGPFVGADLSSEALARLHGVWQTACRRLEDGEDAASQQ
jgi:hypothetical protein